MYITFLSLKLQTPKWNKKNIETKEAQTLRMPRLQQLQKNFGSDALFREKNFFGAKEHCSSVFLFNMKSSVY